MEENQWWEEKRGGESLESSLLFRSSYLDIAGAIRDKRRHFLFVQIKGKKKTFDAGLYLSPILKYSSVTTSESNP